LFATLEGFGSNLPLDRIVAKFIRHGFNLSKATQGEIAQFDRASGKVFAEKLVKHRDDPSAGGKLGNQRVRRGAVADIRHNSIPRAGVDNRTLARSPALGNRGRGA
jgi:hypothetical protein